MFHPIALAFKEHNMTMMSKPVDYRRSHLIVSEYSSPFRKLEVRREHNAPSLIGFGDNTKQKLGSLPVKGYIAPFINDE